MTSPSPSMFAGKKKPAEKKEPKERIPWLLYNHPELEETTTQLKEDLLKKEKK